MTGTGGGGGEPEAMARAAAAASAAAASWDEFYRTRSDVPFLADRPDESLAEWVESGRLRRGRALDVGCGPGRNALYLARRGWQVDAVDLSPQALAMAARRAQDSATRLTLHRGDFLALDLPAGAFDLVYDGGCLHHLRPSLRGAWLERVHRLLRRNGRFALTAFRPEVEAPRGDVDDDRDPGSRTGWSFARKSLRRLLAPRFAVEVLRGMRPLPPDAARMGVGFLWVALARRKSKPGWAGGGSAAQGPSSSQSSAPATR